MSDPTEQILEALDALPEARRREVLDFVESLRAQEEARTDGEERDSGDNPLLDYIGGVEHGSLAQDVDKELYGE